MCVVRVTYVWFFCSLVKCSVTALYRLYTGSIHAIYKILAMVLKDHSCLLALSDDPDYDSPFNARLAEQVQRSMTEILTDMCVVAGVETFDDLKPDNLNKRNITKERLFQWLGAFAYMMNSYANPHLQMAVDRVDKLSTELLEEKKNVIELQSSVMKLQSEAIEKRDEQLTLLTTAVQKEVKSVQGVVQTEMKSYSSALSKTCAAALAPKKIRAAVKTVSDKEDRSRNVIIYGQEESNEENLEDEIVKVLDTIGEKPIISDCCRVGIRKPNGKRPIKFTLRSSDMVNQILRKAKLLRTKEGYRNIYISPDRTVDERRAFKKLLEELQLKRKADTGKVHFIKNNKIVSTDKT